MQVHVIKTAVVIDQILIVVTTVDIAVNVDFALKTAFSIVVVTVIIQFAIV